MAYIPRTNARNTNPNTVRSGAKKLLPAKTRKAKFRKSYRNNPLAIGFIIMFAIIGSYFIFKSFAATPSPSVPIASAGQGSSFWLHLAGTPMSDSLIATEAPRRKFVVLNANEFAAIPKFKAANPKIEVLVYKDLSSTRPSNCVNGVDVPDRAAGVGYCYANVNHPDWFLKDSAGNRIEYEGYPGHWLMDVGNVGYQKKWVSEVQANLALHHWDGVFMDNALVSCNAYSTVCPVKYPTDASIQAAYRSMFATTHPVLGPAGFVSVANITNARLYPGVWSGYLANLDGGLDEYWVQSSAGHPLGDYGSPSVGWKTQVDEVAFAEAHGKFALVQAHTSPTNLAGYYYGLASFLLASGGHSAYAEVYATNGYGDPLPWRAGNDWDLGTPFGSYFPIGTNTYRRNFSCGQAFVNAGTTATIPVALGSVFLDENNTQVSTIAVGPLSGRILRKPSCPSLMIMSPVNAATVSGTVALTAAAPVSATKVEFWRSDFGKLLGAATKTPYGWVYQWNTTGGADGNWNLVARAYNSSAVVTNSSVITVRVKNH